MICLFNKYKKSVQKRTDFFDNSFFNAVPDKPLATRNKPHNNQLCADLSRFISAYPVVSHFLRFAWQTTSAKVEFEVMDAGADYYMIRPFDPETLVSKVLSVYNDKINGRRNTASDESDMECVVTEIIHQIGIPAHIKGYHYLRTAIMLSVEDPDMINCITKLLYPTVARMYETTPSRVERAIRHAIEIAWDRGDVDTLNSYFGYTIHTSRGKPTNSEFVALIADKLRLKYRCTAIYGSKRMKNSPEDSVVRI